MSLKTRISDDMKTAMKAGEKPRLAAIRLLMAAMKQKEVDERIELDDAGIVAVIEKMLKQRKDSIAAFQAAGRTDRSRGIGCQGPRRHGQGDRAGQAQGRWPRRHGRSLEARESETQRQLSGA